MQIAACEKHECLIVLLQKPDMNEGVTSPVSALSLLTNPKTAAVVDEEGVRFYRISVWEDHTTGKG